MVPAPVDTGARRSSAAASSAAPLADPLATKIEALVDATQASLAATPALMSHQPGTSTSKDALSLLADGGSDSIGTKSVGARGMAAFEIVKKEIQSLETQKVLWSRCART